MKTNRYLKWQLKKLLPLILSLFLICAAIFWINSFDAVLTTNTFYDHKYGTPQDTYWQSSYESGLLLIFVIATALAFILPFFAFSYRYDKTSADAFLQFPSKKNQIRNTNILIGLGIIVSIFTVVFWIGILIIYFRYNALPVDGVWHEDYYNVYLTERMDIHYGYYFVSYLFILGSMIGTYFLNCLLVSLGNSFLTSLIYCLLGNIVVISSAAIIYKYSLIFVPGEMKAQIKVSADDILTSIGADLIYVSDVLDELVKHGKVTTIFDAKEVFEAFVIIGWIARYASIPLLFILRDPSGEYFGQPGHKNHWYGIITYGAMFIFGMLVASSFANGLDALSLVIFLLVSIGFYLTIVIFNKSFKLKKNEIITLGSITGSMLLLSIIALI